ncbi:MAG: gamma carbonic anhydrase family protein [Desulfarculus sp.]|nr:gamma carbonic anhydrase family protein [Desulfarculus sp.]
MAQHRQPSRLVSPFGGHQPQIHAQAWVDVSARVIGKVRLAAGVTVWPGAVLRADDEEISIGPGSAVLDLCLLESPHGHPVLVEDGALISHQACLHGATVRAGALVGIGAIVLDGAVVGKGALVGAGALVPPGMEVPEGVLVLGQPARVARQLKPAELGMVARQLKELADKAAVYQAQGGQG